MAVIVVTGATGFVGRHLLPTLAARGHDLIAAGRHPPGADARFVDVGSIGPDTDWSTALRGVDAVVHLAGLAHGKEEDAAAFQRVNAEGTRRLCEAARVAGVRAGVNVSSIAARDAGSGPDRLAAYARSKLDAEAHVTAFADSGKGVGISLRPPLVYGWDAPANWRRLQQLAATGLPLPLGAISNRRSFCAVENLCDALALATEHALLGEGSGTFEIADAEILSLRETMTFLRRGMGMRPRLLPVPTGLLRMVGGLMGQAGTVEALVGDLVATPHRFMRRFGWSPLVSSEAAIAASGRRFVARS